MAFLTAAECEQLAVVLLGLAERSAATSQWPPAHVVRLCPSLVDRVLELLDVMVVEQLLSVAEVLLAHFAYHDDYFADRLAQALALRLPRGSACDFKRGLHALSSNPVALADLLLAREDLMEGHQPRCQAEK